MHAARNVPQSSPVFGPEHRLTLTRYASVAPPSLAGQSTWARAQTTAPMAISKALDNYRPLQAKFVRPDTDEAASDLLAAFVSRSSPVSVNERPQFRTALEQVSYETNSSRMRSGEAKASGFNILGRAAKLFGK